MTKHEDIEERIRQLEERVEQALGEIEYLKERSTRTDKRFTKEIQELAEIGLDDHNRIKEIEDNGLPSLRDELDKHCKHAQQFTIDFAVRIGLLERRKKQVFQAIRSFRNWVRTISDEQDSMGVEMRKLTEVYYHVFPERLDPDTKLLKQLKKIFPLPPLPSSKKKQP